MQEWYRLITIKIKNTQKIVEREKGVFVAHLASHFINLQQRVEEIVLDEIKKALEARGVEAEISIVDEKISGSQKL